MRSVRSLAASVAAFGIAGGFAAPTPVFAAVAPCESTANYAAQAGAELLDISRLSVRAAAGYGNRKAPAHSTPASQAPDASDEPDVADPAGPPDGSEPADSDVGDAAGADTAGRDDGESADADATWTDVGLGEAKTALVTDARVNAAAVARILDGQTTGKAALTEPVTQLAPPTHDKATRRSTPSGRIGPMRVGAGEADAHARWNGGPDCASTPGEASRSGTTLGSIDVLGGLVRVPDRISSVSTTALEQHGDDTRTVASATVTASSIELAHGQVRIRVLRPATLVTSMSRGSGGEVRYRPATIEVSGSGIKTQRLNTVGDSVEVSLATKHAAESSPVTLGGFGSLIAPGRPLPLPTIPGLPSVGAPDQESAPAAGRGTNLRISLGDVRQATKGHAQAARATAIKVAISRSGASSGLPTDKRTRPGYAGKSPTVVLTMGFGLLEAAAMAPEPTEKPAANDTPVVSGIGGGLPITGSQAGLVALAGLGLLFAGGAALAFGRRRRETRF